MRCNQSKTQLLALIVDKVSEIKKTGKTIAVTKGNNITLNKIIEKENLSPCNKE